MHSFLGMVWEGALSVNHYLEIAVFCVAALVLCQSSGVIRVCCGAAFVMVGDAPSAFFVVFVAPRLQACAALAGVAMTTALMAGYMVLRFMVLDIGSPPVGERAVGFGFSRIEPAEIERRFVATGHLYYLYLYNVVSAFASVFLSEPNSGRWMLTQRVVNGDIDPMVATSIVSAVVARPLVSFAIAVVKMGRAAFVLTINWSRVRSVALGNACVLQLRQDEVMARPASSTRNVLSIRYALATGLGRRALASTALVVPLRAAAWTIRTTGSQYQMPVRTVDRYEWAHVTSGLHSQNQTPTTAQGHVSSRPAC
jgi:hypothetical protein